MPNLHFLSKQPSRDCTTVSDDSPGANHSVYRTVIMQINKLVQGHVEGGGQGFQDPPLSCHSLDITAVAGLSSCLLIVCERILFTISSCCTSRVLLQVVYARNRESEKSGAACSVIGAIASARFAAPGAGPGAILTWLVWTALVLGSLSQITCVAPKNARSCA